MKHSFTTYEVKNAIKSLKNNKAPDIDNLSADLLKNSLDELIQRIASLFNNMVKSGSIPEDMKLGFLIALNEPGKKKGKVENLGPIILLNIIRKILAIIILNRIEKKLDKDIPISQAAYRKGRSTTGNVFTFKILAEKVIIEDNAEIHLRLLDMSKAFDNVSRENLINDLKEILQEDELHIVKLLITQVNLQVRNNNTTGEKFQTSKGIPQEDCLSPILFIYYLAETLKDNKENGTILEDHTYNKNFNNERKTPRHLIDHDYSVYQGQGININQEFADNISRLNRYKDVVEELINDDIESKKKKFYYK